MHELYERAQGADDEILGAKLSADMESIRLRILPPLDCSVLATDIPSGAAVLVQLQNTIKGDAKRLGMAPNEWGASKLEEMIGGYSRIGGKYRDLCLDLSSSPSDYSSFVIEGLRERLGLQGELTVWLDQVLRKLALNAFVVLLDDFDLIFADEVRRWLMALLDELHQPQLLFVLTADFYRLEHLSLNPEAEFDDKTGRALLDKLLPPQNRVNLQAWLGGSQGDFKPTPDREKTLWNHVSDAIGEVGTFTGLIRSLLPQRPRGLVNLYESLDGQSAALNGSGEHRVDHILRTLLPVLATSRGEVLLSRRLQELEIEQWSRKLTFEDEPLSVEEWGTSIEAARTRARFAEREGLEPLAGLVPIPTEKDLKRSASGRQASGKSQGDLPSSPLSVLDSWAHDPSWHDPLRHERLRLLPLRDAIPADEGLWTELLINLGMVASPRNRVGFLFRWQPAAHRLRRCRFRVSFSPSTLRDFFADNAGAVHVDALGWIRGAGSGQVEIGWRPLAEVLRGARDPWQLELLAELTVDLTRIRSGPPASGTAAEPHAMLPAELWALVLLVDALSRCPWAPFSTALVWKLMTYLALAAAFVRTAYVLALHESGLIDEPSLSDSQRWLLRVVRERDHAAILGADEEKLLLTVHQIFGDDLSQQLAARDDALSRAARAFLESPSYASVVELLAIQPEIAETPAPASSP